MWSYRLGRISRDLRRYYRHDFSVLPCRQFRPKRDLKYGLPTPPTGTAYIMIKPDSGTLALHVFAEEPYHALLEKMGDMVDSGFDFSEVTGKNLYVATHRDGHFWQGIDTKTMMKEISVYALQHDCAFLVQLDSIDLDLSSLYDNISAELQKIRTPKRVKDEKGYHTEDRPEKGGDLNREGDKIRASLRSRHCSSIVIWCLADNMPGAGFTGSEASIRWLHVDSAVISKTVRWYWRLLRLIIKPKHSKVADIFKSEDCLHYMIRFAINQVVRSEIRRYLTKRKNSPVFVFDGNLHLDPENVQSSGSVDSPSQTRPESLEGVGY